MRHNSRRCAAAVHASRRRPDDACRIAETAEQTFNIVLKSGVDKATCVGHIADGSGRREGRAQLSACARKLE
jgi:hypothetical protein